MDKRYQVFVSSTYTDLKDERRSVFQALMEMDCIPAGMELFPAVDEEQWAFIRRVIDDCDYYLLIIGGRYGSLTNDGISYTEKEFDYAHSQGLPIVALLHGNPDQIPFGKSEVEPSLRAKLETFREKLSTGRLIRTWEDARELPGLVALSMQKTLKTYPRPGWVRATTIANAEVLSELNEVRKRNERLASDNEELKKKQIPVETSLDLASLDENIKLSGTYWSYKTSGKQTWSVTLPWKRLFAVLAPHLLSKPNDAVAKDRMETAVFELTGKDAKLQPKPELKDHDFQTVKIQLTALGLVKTDYSKTTSGGMALFWELTAAGMNTLMDLRTVKSSGSAPNA